jgi:hypothetical protein
MKPEDLGGQNLVVAHYMDGRLIKGYTHDFSPAKAVFHITSEAQEDKGTIHEVILAELKALFFVKILDGRLDYKEKKKFEEVDTSGHRGMKIKLVFADGETMRGVSLGFNRNKKGFFLIPADPDSNNKRIYVVLDAVIDVKLGDAADK